MRGSAKLLTNPKKGGIPLCLHGGPCSHYVSNTELLDPGWTKPVSIRISVAMKMSPLLKMRNCSIAKGVSRCTLSISRQQTGAPTFGISRCRYAVTRNTHVFLAAESCSSNHFSYARISPATCTTTCCRPGECLGSEHLELYMHGTARAGERGTPLASLEDASCFTSGAYFSPLIL